MKAKRWLGALTCIGLVVTTLPGCGTTAHSAVKAEIPKVKALAAKATTVPITERVACMRSSFRAAGSNPGALEVRVDAGLNNTTSNQLVNWASPPSEVGMEARRVLTEMGFNVVIRQESSLKKEPPKYFVSTTVASFTPLHESSTGMDEIDLVVIGYDQELVVAWGSVSVTAVLYAWDGTQYSAWTTTNSRIGFYQIKQRKGLNFALTSGAASTGRGRESIQVASIQDATLAATHDATISLWATALQLNC